MKTPNQTNKKGWLFQLRCPPRFRTRIYCEFALAKYTRFWAAGGVALGALLGLVHPALGALRVSFHVQRGQLTASPDGKALYYTRREGPRQQIARLPVTGGEEELITPPQLFASEPRPHPLGKGLAFIGRDAQGERLFYQPPGGGKVLALTPPGKYRNPQWHPEGGNLVVCQLFGRQWDYLYLDTAGKKRWRLLNYTKGENAAALARRIYVECGAAFDNKGKSLMVTVDGDLWTLKLQNLKPENIMGTEILDALPVTIPRNKGFGFIANERGFAAELYTIKKDGTGLKRYSNSVTSEAPPAFDPRGRFMAYGAWINERRVLVETDLGTRENKRVGTGMFPQFNPVYGEGGKGIFFLEQRGTPEVIIRRIARDTGVETTLPLTGLKGQTAPLPVEVVSYPDPPPETNPWLETTNAQRLPEILKPPPVPNGPRPLPGITRPR